MFKRKKNNRTVRPGEYQRRISATSYYRPAPQPAASGKKKSPVVGAVSYGSEERFTITSLINNAIIIVLAVIVFLATTLTTTPKVLLDENQFAYRPVESYTRKSQSLLGSNLQWRSKLLFRSKEYEAQLLDAFPELAAVEAVVPIENRKITQHMRVSPPVAAMTLAKGGTGVITEAGVLVETDGASVSDLVPVTFTVLPPNLVNGSNVLTSQEIEALALLQKELRSASKLLVKPELKEVVIGTETGQMSVYFKNVPYYLKLTMHADSRDQIGSALVMMKHLQVLGEVPSSYIDVRVPGRAFTR